MGITGKIEAIIYAAEEPVTLDQVVGLLKDSVLQELAAEQAAAQSAAQELVAEQAAPEQPAAHAAATEEQAALEGGLAPETGEQASSDDVPADLPAVEVTEEQSKPKKRSKEDSVDGQVKARIKAEIEKLIAEYASTDRGIEIRQIAGGYRMATKPEHHDVVRAFAKSLKPPMRLSLQALETLAVIAYKQPVTAPEISEIRGVDTGGVIATLLDRKLVTTAGRKAVIGRPILYKTTKEFLVRFGLKDVSELPSMEEFEKLAQDQTDFFAKPGEPALDFAASPNSLESLSREEPATGASPDTEALAEAATESLTEPAPVETEAAEPESEVIAEVESSEQDAKPSTEDAASELKEPVSE